MTHSPSSAPDGTSQGAPPALPPEIARVLDRFGRLGREDKMQALVAWAKKLEPLPQRLATLDRAEFTVPECQTRVDLFAELEQGRLHFYADVDPRQSPTIAAVLAIVFSAVNAQPPSTTLAIPLDFVRRLMDGIGLAAREVGLNAMVQRLKRHASVAQRALAAGGAGAAEGTEGAPLLVHAPLPATMAAPGAPTPEPHP